MRVLLLSTYELGRQPFGLASPAAWLKDAGHEVTCADLAVDPLPVAAVQLADFIGFYVPMHTAARLVGPVVARVRAINSRARLCAYGLYAPLSADYFRELGITTLIGGEFEPALAELAENAPLVSLEKLQFRTPDRTGLPDPARYPGLMTADGRRRSGYTEASRGCRHRCRHCPVVPVYDGQFRVVQRDVVLADIRNQVAAGAEHISFGDPDFFNGPGHARRIVEALHQEFPNLTYDVTVKIEHILQHRELLPVLRETGCLFLISAVESLQDDVLERLEKGHTRADFVEAVHLCREHGLTIAPTFIPFTPWTTREGYADLLQTLADLDLVDNVPPVQLTLRLLIPSSTRLLELGEIREITAGYDPAALIWRWKHRDPAIDRLASDALHVVHEGVRTGATRRETFRNLWELVHGRKMAEDFRILPRTVIPYMEEPWFC